MLSEPEDYLNKSTHFAIGAEELEFVPWNKRGWKERINSTKSPALTPLSLSLSLPSPSFNSLGLFSYLLVKYIIACLSFSLKTLPNIQLKLDSKFLPLRVLGYYCTVPTRMKSNSGEVGRGGCVCKYSFDSLRVHSSSHSFPKHTIHFLSCLFVLLRSLKLLVLVPLSHFSSLVTKPAVTSTFKTTLL